MFAIDIKTLLNKHFKVGVVKAAYGIGSCAANGAGAGLIGK